MCVREPCVEREYRNLHSKTEEHKPEEEFLERNRHSEDIKRELREASTLKSDDIECIRTFASSIVKSNDTNEHEDRTEERIEEELDRCVFAVLATPDSDKEEHREKHYFPINVEEEEIERDGDE